MLCTNHKQVVHDPNVHSERNGWSSKKRKNFTMVLDLECRFMPRMMQKKKSEMKNKTIKRTMMINAKHMWHKLR